MQGQSTVKKYWSKDNYYKPKQSTSNRSSIKESMKGLCTNIWYKLGGQSIMSKKSSSQFEKLIMLGKKYLNYQAAQQDFKELFWFTYRKQVKLPSEIKSDLGWGCLIRVGQMLLANSLKRFFDTKTALTNEQNILSAFLDDSQGKNGNYSFQKILQKGSQKFGLKAGDWFNISQICYVLMSLQNGAPMKGSEQLKMIYFNQTLIFLDEVYQKIGVRMCSCSNRKVICNDCNGKSSQEINYKKKKSINNYNQANSNSFQLDFQDLNLEEAQSQQKTEENLEDDQDNRKSIQNNIKQLQFDLLLVVSTRISQNQIDNKNFQGILDLINLPTSIGVVGGVPGKGLYFVGSCDQNLIYLDPHLVQNPVNRFNLSKQKLSFHCENLRLIGRQKIDPSIAFAFYLRNLSDLQQLVEKIQKIRKKNPEAVPISYMWENQFRESGEYACSNQLQFEDCSPDFSFIA